MHDDPIHTLSWYGGRITNRSKQIALSPGRSLKHFIGHMGSYPRDRKGWNYTLLPIPFIGALFALPVAGVGHFVTWGISGYLAFRTAMLGLYEALPLGRRMETNVGNTPGRHSVVKPHQITLPSREKIQRMDPVARARWDPSAAAHKLEMSERKATALGLDTKIYPSSTLANSGPGMQDPAGPPPVAPSAGIRARRTTTPYEGDQEGLTPQEEQPGEQLRPGPSAQGAILREQGTWPGGSGPSNMVFPGR
jgi:hypothetical protein